MVTLPERFTGAGTSGSTSGLLWPSLAEMPLTTVKRFGAGTLATRYTPSGESEPSGRFRYTLLPTLSPCGAGVLKLMVVPACVKPPPVNLGNAQLPKRLAEDDAVTVKMDPLTLATM